MKKVQLLLIGFGSLLGLLCFAHLGLAQPQCVAVAPHEVAARIIATLQALPPEQAQQAITEFEGLTADEQQGFLEGLRRTLQLLPLPLHQPFINGIFGVSPREAQLAAEILRRVQISVAQGVPLPATCRPGLVI